MIRHWGLYSFPHFILYKRRPPWDTCRCHKGTMAHHMYLQMEITRLGRWLKVHRTIESTLQTQLLCELHCICTPVHTTLPCIAWSICSTAQNTCDDEICSINKSTIYTAPDFCNKGLCWKTISYLLCTFWLDICRAPAGKISAELRPELCRYLLGTHSPQEHMNMTSCHT